MRVSREVAAPDRAAWDAAVKAAVERLGYEPVAGADGAADPAWKTGLPGGYHPESFPHRIRASWADGRGTWTAESLAWTPAARRTLEGRLDALQGVEVPGSALSTLTRACLGGFVGWLFALAVMFLFTVPLCRDARDEWIARQTIFEERGETVRAPSVERIRAMPILPAAFIPAASLAFLVAIPLGLWLAAGELVPAVSRANAAALGVAMLASSASFVTPGVAGAGLAAGLLAPLAAWLGYGLVRAFFADGRVPAHGTRWVVGLVAVVGAAAWPASRFRESDAYSTVRDRVLYGTPLGESIATFYYRHTPLSAFAVRPPALNPRVTMLVAGPMPHGFPHKQWNFLETISTGPTDFLEKARGRGYTFLLFNENGGPWVAEAARELSRTHPSRAAGMVAVSNGGLEPAFRGVDPLQFLTPDFVADGRNKDRKPRIADAIAEAWKRADRRESLRQVSLTSISMSIFLGPVLLVGTVLLSVCTVVIRLRTAGMKRTAAVLAVGTLVLGAMLGHRLATAEGPVQERLREVRARYEGLRQAAARDGARWQDLRNAAMADLPDLTIAASHEAIGVRVLAMDALGAAGQEESFKVLAEKVLHDPSLLVRYRAADAMARCGSRDKRVWYLSEVIFDEAYVAECAVDAMLNQKP